MNNNVGKLQAGKDEGPAKKFPLSEPGCIGLMDAQDIEIAASWSSYHPHYPGSDSFCTRGKQKEKDAELWDMPESCFKKSQINAYFQGLRFLNSLPMVICFIDEVFFVITYGTGREISP